MPTAILNPVRNIRTIGPLLSVALTGDTRQPTISVARESEKIGNQDSDENAKEPERHRKAEGILCHVTGIALAPLGKPGAIQGASDGANDSDHSPAARTRGVSAAISAMRARTSASEPKP